MSESAARYEVLLIGIDRYPDTPLFGCVNDIESFAGVLKDVAQEPAAAVRITRLLAAHGDDEAAAPPTKERIVAELRRLASAEVSPGDHVIVYYAGHGTQRYFPRAECNCEALVPVDYCDDPAQLLFDFELSPLLQAIARRSGDLTVVLDCCNSAGAVRSFGGSLADGKVIRRSRTRYLKSRDRAPLPDFPAAEGALGAKEGTPSSLRRPSPELESRYTVLAAAQSDEAAAEIDRAPEKGGPAGVLSAALVQLLCGEFRGRVLELLWAELWGPLQLRMRAQSRQHPDLVGSLGRRVLGGGDGILDPGLPVRPLPDGSIEVEGGELAGLGPGAEVAVYDLLKPPTFQPLGSPRDLADRLGVIQVYSADDQRALARAAAGTQLALPALGRGRLTRLGSLGKLRVRCAAGVSSWVRAALERYAEEDGLVILGPAAEDFEIELGEDESGALYFGDTIYGHDPRETPAPLATLPVPELDRQAMRRSGMVHSLRAGLRHCSRYVVPLRLSLVCRQPGRALHPESLRVLALDAADPVALQAMEHDAQRIRELPKDASGCYRVCSGAPICFRVHNLSGSALFVTVVQCDSAGRVLILSPSQQLGPSSGCFVWPAGLESEVPFRFELAGRTRAIERIVVIATNSAALDFAWLAEPRTLQDVVAPADAYTFSFCESSDEGPPPFEWTAARVLLDVRPSQPACPADPPEP